jgi:hypothetical protein
MQHSVFLTCNFLQKVLAKNNFELLAKELEDLKNEGYSLDLTGFDFSEAEKLMDEFKEEVESDETEEETVPPPPDDPITKRDDI